MLREYTDKTGVTWRVWDVYPSGKSGPFPTPPDGTSSESLSAYPSRHFRNGWLCFECPSEKRRLAPIPKDWERCDCSRLETLCAKAGHISRMAGSRETGEQEAVD